MQNRIIWALLLGISSVFFAGAQVYYKDTIITLNTNNATAVVNINDDVDTSDVPEFRFRQFVDSTILGNSDTAIKASGVFLEKANSSARAVGLPAGGFYYPSNLSLGETIDSSSVFKGIDPSRNFGQMAIRYGDTVYAYDKFFADSGITDGFIGVRFRSFAGGNDTVREYFGYIRVDVDSNLQSITIKGYGYQKTYGTGIKAGAGSELLSAPSYQPEAKLRIAQRGRFLQLTRNESLTNEELDIEFYSLSGQRLASKKLEAGQSKLPLEFLPDGWYIARTSFEGQVYALKVWGY